MFHLIKNSKGPADTLKEEDKILARAQRKSEALLNQAVQEAEAIISQTRDFKTELEQNLKDDIAFQAAKFARNYQDLLPEIRKYYMEGIDGQLSLLKKHFETLSREMEHSLKDQMHSLQSLLQEQIAQEVAIIQKNLADYKAQQMSNIDAQVKDTVKSAVYAIVGKSFNLTEHEELIRQALTKAKNEGLFKK